MRFIDYLRSRLDKDDDTSNVILEQFSFSRIFYGTYTPRSEYFKKGPITVSAKHNIKNIKKLYIGCALDFRF